mgnify:CR=1 FL=1
MVLGSLGCCAKTAVGYVCCYISSSRMSGNYGSKSCRAYRLKLCAQLAYVPYPAFDVANSLSSYVSDAYHVDHADRHPLYVSNRFELYAIWNISSHESGIVTGLFVRPFTTIFSAISKPLEIYGCALATFPEYELATR